MEIEASPSSCPYHIVVDYGGAKARWRGKELPQLCAPISERKRRLAGIVELSNVTIYEIYLNTLNHRA